MRLHVCRRRRICLIIFCCAALTIVVLSRQSKNVCNYTFNGFQTHTACIRQAMRQADNLYFTLQSVVNSCAPLLCNNTPMAFANSAESKYAYPPSRDNTKPLLITLGIGNDITAELQWRSLYPDTKFLGADPFEYSGRVYDEIGEWHKTGVSGVDGVIQGSVMDPNGWYDVTNLTTITLKQLLARANLSESTVVDQLWMDNEGGEYTLLPLLTAVNTTPIVCQMNVELHGRPQYYGLSNERQFDYFVRQVFGDSSKFDLISVEESWGHLRLGTVNIFDPICKLKFDLNANTEAK